MLSDIEKRVSEWSESTPYYTDSAHREPSHATESVLNATILAAYSRSDSSLIPFTRLALQQAWALQRTAGQNAGGWEWQDFHEAPWEAPESAYQGAVFMALAVGDRPDLYALDLATQQHIQDLKDYLKRQFDAQPPINQIYVLWASGRMQGLLNQNQRSRLLQQISSLQNPDGGWSLSAIDKQAAFKRTLLDIFKRASDSDVSDGCATGLTVLALEEGGVDARDYVLRRGLAWLKDHQRQAGSWWAVSLNGFRNQYSEMGQFMTDAATGYAVLALEEARTRQAEELPGKRSDASSTSRLAVAARAANATSGEAQPQPIPGSRQPYAEYPAP